MQSIRRYVNGIVHVLDAPRERHSTCADFDFYPLCERGIAFMPGHADELPFDNPAVVACTQFKHGQSDFRLQAKITELKEDLGFVRNNVAIVEAEHTSSREVRGGPVCLNSVEPFLKWISRSVMPPPGLVTTG